jgi:hypothetical protein
VPSALTSAVASNSSSAHVPTRIAVSPTLPLHLAQNRLQLRLTWHHTASVWAIDFDPPAPIDGLYSSILVVRSCFRLPTARSTYLRPDRQDRLGCPLASVPTVRTAYRAQSDVDPFSPRNDRLPETVACLPTAVTSSNARYNGSVEAGIGSIKPCSPHRRSTGTAGQWTCDDVKPLVCSPMRSPPRAPTPSVN